MLLTLLADTTVVLACGVVLKLVLLFEITLVLLAVIDVFCNCLFSFFH